MRAASSSSTGSDRKNCRIRKMPNAEASHGTNAAARVSTMPSRANIRYVGIISSWIGIITVARTATNAMPRPAKRSRAKP